MIGLGCVGFIFYLLYDLNQGWWKTKFLQPCFLLGSLLVLAATAGILAKEATLPDSVLDGVFVLFSALCGGLLFYTLFMAIPFEATYVQAKFSTVVDTGVYALCRHPGVLFLAGFYFFLAPAVESAALFWAGVWFSLCNLIYVALQDRFFFPRCFSNYGDYQQSVPFLIPTAKSIRQAKQTWKRKEKSEGMR